MPPKPTLRIGLIVECGNQGAEWKALPVLIRKIRAGLLYELVAMDSKEKLLQSCGEQAKTLFDIGCQYVLIVWDLRPAWPDKKHKPCRREERLKVIDTLNRAGVNSTKVVLLCISMEFEAWLLADGVAITAFIDPDGRWTPVPSHKKTDRNQNPKATLNTIFKPSKYGEYLDREHAVKICEHITSLSRMNKVKSFKRFRSKLDGIVA